MSIETVQLNTETGEIIKRPEPRDLSAFLLDHHNGRTHGELSSEFADLIEAVVTHGKGGLFTIAIKVEPMSAAADSPMAFTVETTSKPPKEKPSAAIFFIDAEGHPVRDNPQQPSLFRTAPAPSTELKDAH